MTPSPGVERIMQIIDGAEPLDEGEIAAILSEDDTRESAAPRVAFPVDYASSLQGKPIPQRQWLWEGWVPANVVTLLSGDGGTGKSLLALQFAVATALGRDWMGSPLAARRVLYLAAEDDADEIHRRLASILEAEGAEFGDLEDRLILKVVSGEDTLLAAPDKSGRRLQTTALYNGLRDFCRDQGVQLVIVDTAADTFGGVEIERQHVTRFVRLLEAIARDSAGAVILIAHPSAAGLKDRTGISGSTAWRNASRSVLWLRFPDDAERTGVPARDQRVLERMKANMAPAEGVLRLLWKAGRFAMDGEDQSPATAFDSLVLESKVESSLRSALHAGRRPSPSKNSTDWIVKIIRPYPEVKGFTIAQIDRAVRQLEAKGRIKVVQVGRPARRRDVYVPSGWEKLDDERASSDLEGSADDL